MEAGLYARMIVRPTLAGTLDAVAAHGFRSVQFGLDCAGLEATPEHVAPETCDAIGAALSARGIAVAAVSGTVNMIDPDPERRASALRRLSTVIEACPRLGGRIVALCTGTRDPVSMWRAHPDNGGPEAWRDLTAALAAVLPAAEASGVDLAMEPEVANVIDSAARARRIIDEMGSPRLKVCIDGANLFHRGELPRMAEILDEAFDLLGRDIVVAHAKDLDHDGEAGHLPAGHGVLDYGRYVSLLARIGYRGAVILHGMSEAQIAGCRDFLQGKIAAAGG